MAHRRDTWYPRQGTHSLRNLVVSATNVAFPGRAVWPRDFSAIQGIRFGSWFHKDFLRESVLFICDIRLSTTGLDFVI